MGWVVKLRRWVCGWQYSITKRVNPCEWKGRDLASLHFDLGLEKTTATQKIKIDQKVSSTDEDNSILLGHLKRLHEEGVLTDEEYKQKSLDVIQRSRK
jgi:hypothetical protein